ncbi:MAG TPA: molecular chaperone TorD family protein [Anaeromyxobacter sp.]|nr:molecular chaperone TorD family protein [Anaeromyxobacter sp.]
MVTHAPPAPDPRSALYRLLAVGFRRPTPERFEVVRDGAYADAIAGVVAALPRLADAARACEALRGSARAPGTPSWEEHVAEFERVFDRGAGRGLHESDHRPEVRATALRLELDDLYREFRVARGDDAGRQVLPDHLAAELALLSYVCFVEASVRTQGDAERVQGCLLAERELLAGHLGRWVPALAARVAAAAPGSWFAALSALAAAVLEKELAHVERLFEPFERAHGERDGDDADPDPDRSAPEPVLLGPRGERLPWR